MADKRWTKDDREKKNGYGMILDMPAQGTKLWCQPKIIKVGQIKMGKF